ADAVARQLRRLALEHAHPAVEEPEHLSLVRPDRVHDGRPDDRVQAGAVAAAGENAQTHFGWRPEWLEGARAARTARTAPVRTRAKYAERHRQGSSGAAPRRRDCA